jgi:hypothetical protein
MLMCAHEKCPGMAWTAVEAPKGVFLYIYQIMACHFLFQETKWTTNGADKELYLSSNQPVKTDGHNFS